MNKSILIVPTVTLLLALSTGVTFAGGIDKETAQCQPIYGGGQSCATTTQFELDKTVQDPKTQEFVDNLGVSDAKYASSDTVTFKITVKNITNKVLKKVVIKDILPDYVDFVAAAGGKYNANTGSVTINLATLASDETRDFFVQVKVKPTDKLPQDQNIVCVVNQSTITVNKKISQDNSQFCIEKGEGEAEVVITPAPTTTSKPSTTKGGIVVTPTAKPTATVNPPTTKGGKPVFPPTQAKKTPDTGPESLALFGLIPTAISGLFLRRKSK